MSNQQIIDLAAARGLAKNLTPEQAALLTLVLNDDSMKTIFLDEMQFFHGPKISMKDDQSSKLVGALDYALGRSTSVPHTIADEIMDYWVYFTPFEKSEIVEKIEEAIKRNRAGQDIDVQKWRQVLEHANTPSGPRL